MPYILGCAAGRDITLLLGTLLMPHNQPTANTSPCLKPSPKTLALAVETLQAELAEQLAEAQQQAEEHRAELEAQLSATNAQLAAALLPAPEAKSPTADHTPPSNPVDALLWKRGACRTTGNMCGI